MPTALEKECIKTYDTPQGSDPYTATSRIKTQHKHDDYRLTFPTRYDATEHGARTSRDAHTAH